MHRSQRGVGMVEVLVAMLLLAIGVIGYSALQVRAIEASSEAQKRSQAMLILRGLADGIRVNTTQQANYPAIVTGYYNAITVGTTPPNAPAHQCLQGDTCAPADMMNFDVYQAALSAYNLGMKINMMTCPGVPASAPFQQQCLLAAWGRTTATYNSAISSTSPSGNDCLIGTGTYNPAATCLVMEVHMI